MSLSWYICIFSNSFRSELFLERGQHNRFWPMRRTLTAFLFFILTAAGVNAQNVNGSVYSYFGIGPLQVRSSAYNRALGYTGVGIRDDYNISAINPAAYNAVVKPFTALFELGAYYESTKHQSVDASSS